jgi:hypothetical protein
MHTNAPARTIRGLHESNVIRMEKMNSMRTISAVLHGGIGIASQVLGGGDC